MPTTGQPSGSESVRGGKSRGDDGPRVRPENETAAREPMVRSPVEAWHRQSKESRAAYGAAKTYFELGPERDLGEVAKICDQAPSRVRQWYVRNDWEARARAFDEQIADVEEGKLEAEDDEGACADEGKEPEAAKEAVSKVDPWEERRTEIREREWKAAELMQDLAVQILTSNMGALIANAPSTHDVIALFRRASELGRLAAEMPSKPVTTRPLPEKTEPATADSGTAEGGEL